MPRVFVPPTVLGISSLCLFLVSSAGVVALFEPVVHPAPVALDAPGVFAPTPPRQPGALLVVHQEWGNGARIAEVDFGRRCPESRSLMDSELNAVTEVLASMGLPVTVIDAAQLTGNEEAVLVVYHNGGWGSRLEPLTQQALVNLHERGVPLLFAGDDTVQMGLRDPWFLDTIGVRTFLGSGDYPATIEVGGSTIRYDKDPDRAILREGATVRARSAGAEVVWTAPGRDGGRVGVFDLGIRASDTCPVASLPDEEVLRGLFRELATDLVR